MAKAKSGRGSQGGRGSGRVSAVFEESVVANHVQAAASSLLLLDSGANRIIIKNRKLMTTIDRSKTSNLRTADSKNSLHVDGIGTIGILEDVKFCERATTDLIAVSKLGQIGFKTSFDDAEGPVVIRRRSTGNVVCIGVQMNDPYWITEDQFMDIAYNDGKNIEKQHRRSELVSMGTSEQKHVGGMFQTTISFWTQNIKQTCTKIPKIRYSRVRHLCPGENNQAKFQQSSSNLRKWSWRFYLSGLCSIYQLPITTGISIWGCIY